MEEARVRQVVRVYTANPRGVTWGSEKSLAKLKVKRDNHCESRAKSASVTVSENERSVKHLRPKSANIKIQEDDTPESERSLGERRSRSRRPQTAPGLLSPTQSPLLRNILSRSNTDMNSIMVSSQDLRVLEALALKTQTETEFEQKKRLLHSQWEKEDHTRQLRKAELDKELQRQVLLRRRFESTEREIKIREMQEELKQSQQSLKTLLAERDAKKTQLLIKIRDEKASQIAERLRVEEERRQEAEERVSRCRSRGEGAQVLRKRQEAAQERRSQARHERGRESSEKQRSKSLENRSRKEQEHQKEVEERHRLHLNILGKLTTAAKNRTEKIVEKAGRSRSRETTLTRVTASQAERAAEREAWKNRMVVGREEALQAAEKRLKDGEKEREERTRRQREEKERRYREEREKQEARREKQRVDLKPTAREGVGQKVAEMLKQRSAVAEGARKRAVEVARLKRLIRDRGAALEEGTGEKVLEERLATFMHLTVHM